MNPGTRRMMKITGLFKEQLERIDAGLCPMCGRKINAADFKDPLSFKEFTISGMCQICQDTTFKEDKHEM